MPPCSTPDCPEEGRHLDVDGDWRCHYHYTPNADRESELTEACRLALDAIYEHDLVTETGARSEIAEQAEMALRRALRLGAPSP